MQLKSVNSKLLPDLIVDSGVIEINKPSAIYDVVDGVVVRGDINLD